jgi:hypothetical protein
MLNSETLEVAIGMAFLFLLMSLVCTAIKEWLEGVLKWRAMDLERALRTLLDDAAGEVTLDLYRHPLIHSLFQGSYDPASLRSSMMTPGKGAMHMRLRDRRNLPSYIPAGHFATAFIDLVGRGPVAAGPADDAQEVSIAMLRQRAAALPSPHLRRAMLSAMDPAGDNIDQIRLNLQRWFDGTMDRASGWYKRRTQAVLFMLGLGAAVVLNVDALHVMSRLTADKTFRDAVVKRAEGPPLAADAASAAVREQLQSLRAEIRDVGIPMGWVGWYPHQLCAVADVATDTCTSPSTNRKRWLHVALGWLVTAFAVMLGAPFWFDVLNKIMVIRSTVKPHEKSPEEGSEDRLPRVAAGPAPAGAAANPALPLNPPAAR